MHLESVFEFPESQLVFTEIIYIIILKNLLKLDVEPLFIYLVPLSDAFVFLSFFFIIYIVRFFFLNSLHFAFVTFLVVIKYPDEIQVRGKLFWLIVHQGIWSNMAGKAYGIAVRKQNDLFSSIHWK